MWTFATSAGQAPVGSDGGARPVAPLPLASMSFSIAREQQPNEQQRASAPTMVLPRGRAPLPLASLSAAVAKESHTGVAFPGDYCVHTRAHCPELTGTGVRAKRVLGLKNINVYALGLYVDGPAAKRALRSSGAPTQGNQKPFDALVKGCDGVERTLRLVITTGLLKRSTFVSTLEERLGPALRKAGEDQTFESFAALFDGVDFKSGTEVVFSTKGGGKLSTRIDGKEKAALSSRALCESLLDIYLGRDPVSPDAKRAFGEGLASMMKE